MAQVAIGREFFEKIKYDYSNWRWALIREFLQNSMDAPNSRNISVTIKPEGLNTLLIVENDGEPMDEHTLTHKLLTLGGSGKDFASNSVGGFGVAKSLLYYCHLEYRIYSGQWYVQGSGAQYEMIGG